MEKVVVPALCQDLNFLEVTVSSLERKMSSKELSSSTVNAWLSLLSGPLPVDSVKLPDVELHDAETLLSELHNCQDPL